MLDHEEKQYDFKRWNWAKCEDVTGDQITGREEETLYKDQMPPQIESPVTECLLEHELMKMVAVIIIIAIVGVR